MKKNFYDKMNKCSKMYAKIKTLIIIKRMELACCKQLFFLAIALFQCKIEKNEVTHVFIAKAIYLVSIVSKCAAFAIVSLLFYFTQIVSFHLLQLATTVCRTLSDFFCIFMLIFPHHTLDCSINIF